VVLRIWNNPATSGKHTDIYDGNFVKRHYDNSAITRLPRTAADPESRIAAGGGSRQVRGRSDRLSVDPKKENATVVKRR
jgi:hypothetical protein